MAALPELIHDAIAEILLRLPPGEPVCLVRAALVCKTWRRILSDPAFSHRYRTFHRAPPLLGYLGGRIDGNHFEDVLTREFVPIAEVSPRFSSPLFRCCYWWALDCRHGRVLFRCTEPHSLVVWDPITDDEHHMIPQTEIENDSMLVSGAGAVLCAVDGCNHLDCHGGPFLVVSVVHDFDQDVTWASMYSSENGVWSYKEFDFGFPCCIEPIPCLLTGSAIYFVARMNLCLFKYDLALQDLSVVDTPEEFHSEFMGTIMTAEGGGLGLAVVDEVDYGLHLWAYQAGADGSEDWVHHKVIDLKAMLPIHALSSFIRPCGFVEGSNTIFMYTSVGIFAIELNSGQVRKVGKGGPYYFIIPYMSFYTPDLTEAILLQP